MPVTVGRICPRRQVRRLGVLVALLTAMSGCGGEETPQTEAPAPVFQPTATVEELMRWMIDPAADALWDAVVTTSTPEGLEEVKPETEGDWIRLERHALVLAEAGNLLQIDRPVAGPDAVSDLPGVDLSPEAIAALVDADPETWRRTARELHDVGAALLAGIRARDLDALLAGGERLDVACESCHSRFWYPPTPGGGDERSSR